MVYLATRKTGLHKLADGWWLTLTPVGEGLPMGGVQVCRTDVDI